MRSVGERSKICQFASVTGLKLVDALHEREADQITRVAASRIPVEEPAVDIDGRGQQVAVTRGMELSERIARVDDIDAAAGCEVAAEAGRGDVVRRLRLCARLRPAPHRPCQSCYRRVAAPSRFA